MKALFLFATHQPADSKAKSLGNRVMKLFSDYSQQGNQVTIPTSFFIFNKNYFQENEDNRYGSLLLLAAFVREMALHLKETLLIANCTDPLGEFLM